MARPALAPLGAAKRATPAPGEGRTNMMTKGTGMGLAFKTTAVTAFSQNCSLIWCEETKKAALVDPGGEADHLLELVEAEGLTLEKILVTHGHLDHAGAVQELATRTNCPIEGPHPEDAFWIDGMDEQSRAFGLPTSGPFTPTRWLDHDARVTLGNVVLQVVHCPGHTPGHVVFVSVDDRIAFVGDVLFAGSIGRTDFPRGNHGDLIRSIKERLLPLGSDIRFVPGHGPMSSFGAEARNNPYLV
ncbi:MAG: MBL fold metallo-hydrolase [Rhodospirillaceae bacterium]